MPAGVVTTIQIEVATSRTGLDSRTFTRSRSLDLGGLSAPSIRQITSGVEFADGVVEGTEPDRRLRKSPPTICVTFARTTPQARPTAQLDGPVQDVWSWLWCTCI